MSATIQAIPTLHRGIKFRSRLEARWAVFFDTLGVSYEYEKEGYTLPPVPETDENAVHYPLGMTDTPPWRTDTLHYLPDFYIASQRKFPKPLWVEVKGVEDADTWEKIARLCHYTKTNGTVLYAVPALPDDVQYGYDGYGYSTTKLADQEFPLVPAAMYGGEDLGYSFCECPFCGAFGWEFNGRSARVGCGCKQHADIANGDKTYNDGSPTLLRAYSAARSARFGT